MKKRTANTLILAAVAIPIAAVVIGLAITGTTTNWGPFAFLHSWEQEVSAIEDRYDPAERSGGIVFYGASNFAQWTELDHDFPEYRVQNHAFGGSTDKDLLEYADRLLYPYKPAIVVLQTGSNDYVRMGGSDDERITMVLEYKRAMFETFHAHLPETNIIVMSGLLMPGRSEFTPMIQGINDGVAVLAHELDYVTFVDAERLTWSGDTYDETLFVADGIHLTHPARIDWADQYIRPAIEAVIDEHDLDAVRD